MNNMSLFDKSKKIADGFIQNILFIDDEIYPDQKGNHNLDGKELVKSFSRARKLCALNNPQKEKDFEDAIHIAQMSDITILDWKLNLEDEGEDEDEVVVEQIDPRGGYTLKLIKDVLQIGQEEFKLILIYTGETDLYNILETLGKELKLLGVEKLESENGNVLGKSNIRIIVTAKPSLKGQFNHNPELNNWVLDYENVPEFILVEFTKMTEGILSAFILSSLSLIRKNIFKLIHLYNKELDQPYFFHKLLLPNPDDSLEQLIEVITHSFQSILCYHNDNDGIIPEDLIIDWLIEKNFSFKERICKKDIEIDTNFLVDWIKVGYDEKFSKYWAEKNFPMDSLKDLDKGLNALSKKGSGILNDSNGVKDIDFSILTHHKSNLKQPSQRPRLTLGSIIYKIEESGEKNYFMCLQAKCDSVRVKKGQRFIFLELEKKDGDSKFNFISKDTDNQPLKFRYKNKSYDIKTFKFDPTERKDIVLAQLDNESSMYYFQTTWGEKLFWLFDLKDLHAHRIANIFASQLARVGLDESEWLRRWSD